MLFLIIGTVAGVLLGLRFKVFVLIPFMLYYRVRNHRNGRWTEGNCFHDIGVGGNASGRYALGLVIRVSCYVIATKTRRYQRQKSNSGLKPIPSEWQSP